MSRTTSSDPARASGRRRALVAAAPGGVVWLNEIDIDIGDFRPSYDDLEDVDYAPVTVQVGFSYGF